jgi:hypothetical protein
MRLSAQVFLPLLFSGGAVAQDLDTILQGYPRADTFRQLLKTFPGGINVIVPPGSYPNGVTLLIPDNAAFAKFASDSGVTSITQISQSVLLPRVQYHVMAAKLTSSNFSTPGGLIVPTLLKDQQYNNRTPGAELMQTYGPQAASGQVLYISGDPINPVRMRARQGSIANIRGGIGAGANLDAVDGQWQMGYFQFIDT